MLKTMLHSQFQVFSTVFSATVSKNKNVLNETITMEISISYKDNVRRSAKVVLRFLHLVMQSECLTRNILLPHSKPSKATASCRILDARIKFHTVVKSSFIQMSFMSNGNFRSALDTYERDTKEQTEKIAAKGNDSKGKHAFRTQLGCLP